MSNSKARSGYHHGNLRSALVDAALELAREGGPDAVVVREASRRAGVSHNAAYRHFADRDGLLRTVCGRCMAELARLMERRIAETAPAGGELARARARLNACGRAYVEFALSEPGWFRTAFAVPAGLAWFEPGEGVGERGLGPLELVSEQLDALDAAGGVAPGRRVHAELSAWSAVHGLSTLLLDGPLRSLPDGDREQALARLLATIEHGLEE
jgi:AcrR family transcriptional regulator